MRYAASDRVEIELHGVMCSVIPGRKIVTATISNAGKAQPTRVSGHNIADAERIERIRDYLARYPESSAYSIGLGTAQGYRKVTGILESHPELFVVTRIAERGRSGESAKWRNAFDRA